MKKLLQMLTILCLCQTFAAAQPAKFRWTTELCEYEGAFNAAKHTHAELQNTLELLSPMAFNLETDATVWKFEEIANLNVAALDKEYNLDSTRLKNLKVVKSAYWQELKQQELNELEQVYRLSRTTMLAYKNPAALKEYVGADSCVATYANPLAVGGDELLRVWRQVNEASRKQNADPERLRLIFEQQLGTADKYKYAQVEVMSFGWWNCANNFINRPTYDEQQQTEFKKLFKTVKTISCDEP